MGESDGAAEEGEEKKRGGAGLVLLLRKKIKRKPSYVQEETSYVRVGRLGRLTDETDETSELSPSEVTARAIRVDTSKHSGNLTLKSESIIIFNLIQTIIMLLGICFSCYRASNVTPPRFVLV